MKRPKEDEDGGVDADHVEDEDVPAPCGDHVAVCRRRHERPRPRARRAQRAAPKVEGSDDGGDGDRLVVEAAGDGAHQVGGEDRHEEGGGDARVRGTGRLVCDEPREGRREEPKRRRDEDADVVERGGGRDLVREGVGEADEAGVDAPRRQLQAGVRCRADVPSERVPHLVIVPRLR